MLRRRSGCIFDVMDGHFVPNLTFGPDILKGFCRGSDLFKDVHLMVDDPDFISSIFIPAGAQMITFHYEALSDGVYGGRGTHKRKIL